MQVRYERQEACLPRGRQETRARQFLCGVASCPPRWVFAREKIEPVSAVTYGSELP